MCHSFKFNTYKFTKVIVFRTGRLCGGTHEISGIKTQLFLCGWVGGGGVGGEVGWWDGGGRVVGEGVGWVVVRWGWWGGW